MDLFFTGTRDQALLAMAVQEASLVASTRPNAYVGRTAVQKILYHLKVMGVSMNYSFELYRYGPFCDAIIRDMEWLQADSVVLDDSKHPDRYSAYKPGPAVDALLGKHGATLEKYRQKVRKVAAALAPFDPKQMELIATLDYVHRWEAATDAETPLRERVLARFHKAKPGKFDLEEVERTYDSMLACQLLPEDLGGNGR